LSKHIVMLHGANCGAWCFDPFRAVFEDSGWTCHAPDLIGHGTRANGPNELIGVSMTDYEKELLSYLDDFDEAHVVLGHSMGGALAQMLAARGKAAALILLSPAPRAGILPATDAEKQLAQALMAMGAFWTGLINPVFDLASFYTLNCIPAERRRDVFDRFGPESGRAFFELFFWMFDIARATTVDVSAIECPVLCVSGLEDRLISPLIAQATVAPLKRAELWELAGHGHMLPMEPGAPDLARRIAAWASA
jgi:non-heme chloroperoxidase